MADLLITRVRTALLADLATLGDFGTGTLARRTRERFNAVAEDFPPILILLAEPWLQTTPTVRTLELLTECARIHLYARILDDALDENLLLHRTLLLRAQPLLWRALGRLSAHCPQLVDACADLVAETVAAVEADDRTASPAHWGTKNHHLLLVPLLLSGADTNYQAARPGLSAFIAAVQAVEEWQQGILMSPPVEALLLQQLPLWIAAQHLDSLLQHGWQGAAQRLTSATHWLLERLERNRNHDASDES